MSKPELKTLDAASRGFRARYLSHDELSDQLRVWAESFPDIVRVTPIGKTDEGRSIELVTIGPDPDRVRPAVWVDGNMHASELCGSSVALGIAEDMIRMHLDPDHVPSDVPDAAAARLRDVLFYVLPRMSPDGAERVLTTARYARSSPRDQRPNRNHARWITGDVDGDGLALAMRMEHPTGEFVESTEVPNLMLVRQIHDAGPYYKLYPEGTIENFDGHTIPSPSFLSDTQTDLNRNFPWSWAPEHEQVGAGSFPLSEPETRAVVEFTSTHPEIFAWLNIHTFGGVFIRPLGHKPDVKMDPADLALFKEIGTWCEELTGYPMVSGFEEFTYEPEKPLHGDLTDYAFHQRGAVAYVVELWDLFAQVGFERPKRFVEHYTHRTREDLVAIGKWDAEHNKGRAVLPWRPFDHPQLGPVELGGIDARFGIWNPPPERIAEVCTQQSAAFLRVASLAPALSVRSTTETTDEGRTTLTVTVDNLGYLPTYVLASSRKLDFNEPVYATAELSGCTLEVAAQTHREVGHLDGWGRGKFDGTGALYYAFGRGTTGSRTLVYSVHGAGTVTLRVGSCRTGWVTHQVTV